MKLDIEPPYDVVIASFSLGMPDIRAAVEKIREASSEYICLYHFAGKTPWDRIWSELWPKLHGREYCPGPKCDVLYNVLYQMGIYLNIRTFSIEYSQTYSSVDEAVSALWPQARAEHEEKKAILRDYLRRACERVVHYCCQDHQSGRRCGWEKNPGRIEKPL